MCGRFTYLYRWRQIYEILSEFLAGLDPALADLDGPTPSYNVGPKSVVPVLRNGAEGVTGTTMRWWLIPSWSLTPDIKFPTFNARSEEAAKKNSFRKPFRERRCVLPVSGFYEWAKRPDGSKQPYYITRADGEVIMFAGLWDAWGDPEVGPPIESCTILTTSANTQMEPVHDRMPCVLEAEQLAAWLDPEMTDPDEIGGYLNPAADGVLTMHPVGRKVGNVRNQGAGLIAPIV